MEGNHRRAQVRDPIVDRVPIAYTEVNGECRVTNPSYVGIASEAGNLIIGSPYAQFRHSGRAAGKQPDRSFHSNSF